MDMFQEFVNAINYYSLNQYLDIVFRSRSHHFFVTVLPEEVQKAFV